jgi:hypothetical protein
LWGSRRGGQSPWHKELLMWRPKFMIRELQALQPGCGRDVGRMRDEAMWNQLS